MAGNMVLCLNTETVLSLLYMLETDLLKSESKITIIRSISRSVPVFHGSEIWTV
jgi:hypothetical protein